jgi:hypothetical protein
VRSAQRCRAADRAEAFSLLGSNAKTRGRTIGATRSGARGKRALASAHLGDALDRYLKAFAEDLGGYYPGANALAMLRIQSELAKGSPTPGKRRSKIGQGSRRAQGPRALREAHCGIAQPDARIDPMFRVKDDDGDPWRAITRADVMFLTSDKPTRVENEYRKALARVRNEPFSISAVRRNIEMFEALGAHRQRRVGAACHRRGARSDRKMPAPQERLRGSCSSPAT